MAQAMRRERRTSFPLCGKTMNPLQYLNAPRSRIVEIPGDPSLKPVDEDTVTRASTEALKLALPKGCWAGRRCFLIGGGPSLKRFDWSRLHGELTIGVNRAFEKHDPCVIYSMDTRLWGWLVRGDLGSYAKKRFEKSEAIKVWLKIGPMTPPPQDVYLLRSAGRDAFTTRFHDGLGAGCNSGYGALNIAAILGADPIYLLGYDMGGATPSGHQSWWHSGYPSVSSACVYEDRMIPCFDAIAPTLKERGIRVVNLNPESALTCFEFGDIADVAPAPKRPIVVSFYTQGTGYEREVERLKLSLRRFGFISHIVGLPTLGSWQKNTQHKAEFLLSMLDLFAGTSIVWLDADAEVRQYPTLFETLKGVTFGAHWRNRGDGREELLSGTLYLGNTDSVRTLLKKWRDICKANPDMWDQIALSKALEGWRGRIARLPPEYCCIFDSMAREVEHPVIEHFQASRHLKAEVG